MDKKLENLIEVAALDEGKFVVNALCIVFDTSRKKILVGRREKDPYVKNLKWCFPGGMVKKNLTVEESLKKNVKDKTGLNVDVLGPIFSRVFPEENNLFLIYYLCTLQGGKEKPGDNFIELKWVDPETLEKIFTTSINPRLKNFILSLKA